MHLGVALRGLSGPDTYTRVASIRIRTTSSTPGMTRDIQPDGACTDTAAGRVCWRHVHSHNLPRHSDPSQAAIEYYQYWVFSILPVPTLDIYILIISRFRRRTHGYRHRVAAPRYRRSHCYRSRSFRNARQGIGNCFNQFWHPLLYRSRNSMAFADGMLHRIGELPIPGHHSVQSPRSGGSLFRPYYQLIHRNGAMTVLRHFPEWPCLG
jgi:hypothetical protein